MLYQSAMGCIKNSVQENGSASARSTSFCESMVVGLGYHFLIRYAIDIAADSAPKFSAIVMKYARILHLVSRSVFESNKISFSAHKITLLWNIINLKSFCIGTMMHLEVNSNFSFSLRLG